MAMTVTYVDRQKNIPPAMAIVDRRSVVLR